MPCPRCAHAPPARQPLPRRTHRRNPAGPRRLRPDRRARYHAGDYVGDRGLDPGVPGSVALAAPALAVGAARLVARNPPLPVFTLVHSRLMIRWVAGLRVVLMNSRFS